MREAQITIPLGIPNVRVIRTDINESGEYIITIESANKGTSCCKCGRHITKLHGHDEWVTIRHLPVFGVRSYLRYRPQRFQCLYCSGNPTTTEKLEWHDARSPHSYAYDNHILLQLVNSTVADVSVKEGLSYGRVEGALARRIDAQVNWAEIGEIERLGIDEIALKKGRKNYATLITGRLSNGEIIILGVLAGHEKAPLVEFLRSIPPRILQKVQSVCCDLWEAYIQAAREEIPNARVVADRFHVAKHYRDGADDERKQELRRLKKELPQEEYKTLKGVMNAYRKNAKDLSKEEHKLLLTFFKRSASAKQAYDLREQLTAIFETNLSKKQALSKIQRWMQRVRESGLRCFDDFLKLFENWQDEITNYFVARENSGFVEGFNNKVKVIKRRCYGVFNLKHLFQRIYLDLSGYRLFAPTPIYG